MIDPVKLSRALRHLILWDVLPENAGYRCRLAGTAICAAAQRELRGARLEEMHGSGSAVVRGEFDIVRDRRQAHFVERQMDWVAPTHGSYKRLLLPLANADGTVDSLLGTIVFESDEERIDPWRCVR